MAEFMRDDFRAIYDNPHGTRRAIITRGRKNAKTAESAMIVLLHLCGPEARPNSSLFSDAQSRDQAGVLFSLAAKMVRMSATLAAFVSIRDTAKQLYCTELGTLYRALSADANTALGLSPAVSVHDELGQVKGPKSPLYEALETATAAQDEPLSIIISTQAPTDADLLSILIDDAIAGHDPHTVLRMQSASDDLDPFSEEAIRAANPAFDIFMNKAEVLAMAADAKRMPSREPDYRNLILNQRVEVFAPFISKSLWLTCAGPVVESFGDEPVWGGLDLSEVNDLTALILGANFGGAWNVKPTFWLPAEGITERATHDRVPYDVWVKDGYIETVPGKSVSYEFVAAYLRDCFVEMNIQKIAFDRWNWRHFKPWLLKVGFTEEELEAHFVEFGQGFQSMSPAMRDLESAILNGKIRHGGHPVLRMCAANAVVTRDPAGNRKLNKAKSRGRIDGMSALVDFMGAVPEIVDTAKSFWETAA